jgi:UDP-glucose 4-epimerase
MAVLVTGGAGYIGSHVAYDLLSQGEKVVIVDNLSKGFRQLIPSGAVFYRADLSDLTSIENIFEKENIQEVVHLAAFHILPESIQEPIRYYDNNICGLLNLLKCCQKFSTKHFLFSSTAAVYSDPGTELVNEHSDQNPKNPYGRSKLVGEWMLQDFSFIHPMNHLSLRYFNVAGASSDLQRGPLRPELTSIVKVIAEVAAGTREQFQITGTDYPTFDGTGVRDFIHVEDLARLHSLGLFYLRKEKGNFAVNCGYGKGFSVRQVVQSMERVCGRKLPVAEAPRRPGDLAQVVTETKLLRSMFDWSSKFSDLDQICSSAYQWELKKKGKQL